MARVYSTYEAKARFSEIIRAVRDGHSVLIRYRGGTVAEIRPSAAPAETLADRIAELERAGILGRGAVATTRIEPMTHVEGGLQRFLDERE